MKPTRLHRRLALTLVSASMIASLASCDSAIYDDEGDCSIAYEVKFSYERNIQFRELFPEQVRSVELYAFDPDSHRLLWSGTETGNALADPDYTMSLPLPAGDYDLVAWGGHVGSDHFTLAPQGRAASVQTLDQLICRLNRTAAESSDDLTPLFHGMVSRVNLPDTFGTVITRVMPVMKNTNRIHVEFTSNNGHPIDPSGFEIYITDCNGVMNYDNALLSDETITFRPWTTDFEGEKPLEFRTSMTTVRLMTDGKTRLTVIRKKDGEKIIDLLLPSLLAQAKAQYNHPMSDQEYLDRQDEHILRFTLAGDPGYETWYIEAGLYINSWRVVINNPDL